MAVIRTPGGDRRRGDISNVNRSVGALISGEIARFYGDAGLPKRRSPSG